MNGFPILSQAATDEDFDKIIKNTVEFLDQKSWVVLLQVNQRFNALTIQWVKSLKIKGDSAADIKVKLTTLLLKDGAEGQVHIALESLDFSRSNITAEVLRDLVAFIQEHFPNIKELNLSWNKIGAAGAAYLAGFTQLETLDLFGNEIGDAGAVYLAGLTRLKWLDLCENSLSDVGAIYLSGLTELETLDLAGNKIGAAGAACLTGLARLNFLDFGGNDMSPSLISLHSLGSSVTISY